MQKSVLVFLIFFISTLLFAHEGKHLEINEYPFITNKGQWPENVKFKSENGETTIYFERDAFHFQFIDQSSLHPHSFNKKEKKQHEKEGIKGHNFKAKFIGSNESVSFEQVGRSPFYYNYFIGNDKSKWKGNVRLYESITYRGLYDGIDLVSYKQEGLLKYDYHVAPSTSPTQIQVQYLGVDQPVIKDGQLIISHSLGQVVEQKPFAYQIIDGKKVEVTCEFVFNESGFLAFSFPNSYNHEVELIIDPVLIFSTYSGSRADNFGMTATYDNQGNAYMGGIAYGNGYDTSLGAFQTRFAGTIDIAISKINTGGNTLEYSTYVGGTGLETVHSMVVNDNEELFILGATSSSNYPVTSDAFDTLKTTSANIQTDVGHRFVGGADIIITKFDALGQNLLGSTYFGGNATDGINYNPGIGSNNNLVFNYGDSHRGEIVLDSIGNCYIGTSTSSTSLSSINTKSTAQDGLIAKFKPNLDSLIWSRYLGGSSQDAIYSLKVIDNNRVLVGGGTQSFDFPITTGSYQDQEPGGRSDGFISIISSDGLTIDKSTYIGTTDYDQVYFIEFDRFNNIYALGQSRGGIFPIKNSTVADSAAGQFIVKLDQNLDSTIYSTTFGDGNGNGRINISPTAFLVDRCQNAYASGWGGTLSNAADGGKTLTNNMPLTSNAYDSTTDNNDFYLYAIDRFADSLIYGSYFGDPNSEDHVDGGTSRFDKQGIIYQSVCASCGGNNTFPTLNAYSTTNGSNNCNNAVFKLDFQVLPVADFTTTLDTFCINEAALDTFAITISNNSTRADITTWDFYGTKVVSEFTDTTIFITQAGFYYIRADVEDTVCATGDFKETTIFARPDNINIITSRDTTICYVDSAQIGAFTNGFANSFTWSKNSDFSNPIASNDSVVKVLLDSGVNVFYVLAENTITQACEKIDSIEVFYVPVTSDATISETTVCENTTVQLNAILKNVDRYVWDLANGDLDSTNLSISVSYDTPSLYSISLELENFLCSTKDTIPLPLNVVSNNLLFDNLTDTLFCGAQGFRVSKSSLGTANEFLWSSNSAFSDTLNSSLLDSTFLIQESDSAKYYVRISDQYCERIDSINAEYIEYDLMLTVPEDSACSPFTTELQTTILGADSFRIFFGNGSSTSIDSTPQVTYSNAGVFNVQLVASNNKCNIQDTISDVIEVFQDVAVTTSLDTIVCVGDTITITGNSFGTATSFFWDVSKNFDQPLNNPNDSFLRVFPTQNTTYYFKGENVICEAIDSVEVSSELLEIDLDDVVSICLEDSFLIEANIINSLSPLTFVWSPNDSIISGQGTSTILTSPREDMKFFLSTTSQAGCEDFDSVDVDVNFPAFTTAEILSSLDSLFKGQTAQLSTNRNGSNLIYFWEPDSGLSNPNSPNPLLKAIESKTYKVSITDLNTGCVVEAFKRIKVFEVNCGEPDIFIPTAFTPNKDLSNDVLFVRGTNVKSINFQLYNRWGEKVFETNDINTGWDGTYKGREVDPGVFVYHLKAICFDDQEYFTKGDITLIR